MDMTANVFQNTPQLLYLNLSNNHLTNVVLPNYGKLLTLDLSNNPISQLDMAGLVISLDLNQMTYLNVSTYFKNINIQCGFNPAARHPTNRVNCACINMSLPCPLVPWVDSFPNISCSQLFLQQFNASEQPPSWLTTVIPAAYVCDGISDCPDGLDEQGCYAKAKLANTASLHDYNASSSCQLLSYCVQAMEFTATFGAFLLKSPSTSCAGASVRPVFPFVLGASTPIASFERLTGDILHARGQYIYVNYSSELGYMMGWAVVTNNALQYVANVTLIDSQGNIFAGPSICALNYSLTYDDLTVSLPLVAPPSPLSSSPKHKGSVLVPVFASIGSVAVVVIFVACGMQLAQKRRERLAGKMLTAQTGSNLESLLDEALQSMSRHVMLPSGYSANRTAWGDTDQNNSINISCTSSTATISPLALDCFLLDESNFEAGPEIGRGHFGVVCKGEYKDFGPVAVKYFSDLKVRCGWIDVMCSSSNTLSFHFPTRLRLILSQFWRRFWFWKESVTTAILCKCWECLGTHRQD